MFFVKQEMCIGIIPFFLLVLYQKLPGSARNKKERNTPHDLF